MATTSRAVIDPECIGAEASCQVVGCRQPALPQRTVLVDDRVELEVNVCLGHVLPGELWSDQIAVEVQP